MPKKIEPKRGWKRGGHVPTFFFSDEEQNELRDIVNDDLFIERMQYAVTRYQIARKHDLDEPCKKEIKAAVDELESSLSIFLHSITHLDAKTREHIKYGWVRVGGKLDQVSRFLPATHKKLHDLYQLHEAIALSKRETDRIPDHETRSASRVLANIVAEILEAYNIPITTTENGIFNRCLAIASYEEKEMTRNWARSWVKSST
ncbi:MAG: hypothetical protein KZQ90_20160 [Candidatus Thiodiazotropha sp. (ex Codakia rugifera)]|nr:hypothetical protein [Candidatus Thiodiazotropha sp. (ex Codakia rugifera)]